MRPIPAPRLGDTHGLLRAINQRERVRLDEFITEFSVEDLFPPGLENALGRTRQFVSFARSAGLLNEDRGVVELTEVGKRYVRSGDQDAVFDVSSGQAEWLRRQLFERHMTDSIYHGAAIGLSLFASNPPDFHVSRLDFGRALAHLGRAGWDNENTLESQGERYTTFLRDLELLDDQSRLTEIGTQTKSELTLPVHMSLRDLAGQLNPGGIEAAEAEGEAEWAARSTAPEPEPEPEEPAAVEPEPEPEPEEAEDEPVAPPAIDTGEYEDVAGAAAQARAAEPTGRPVPPSDIWETAAPDEVTRAYSAISPEQAAAAAVEGSVPPVEEEEPESVAPPGMTSGDPLAGGVTSGDPLAQQEPVAVEGPGLESADPEIAADAPPPAAAEAQRIEPAGEAEAEPAADAPLPVVGLPADLAEAPAADGEAALADEPADEEAAFAEEAAGDEEAALAEEPVDDLAEAPADEEEAAVAEAALAETDSEEPAVEAEDEADVADRAAATALAAGLSEAPAGAGEAGTAGPAAEVLEEPAADEEPAAGEVAAAEAVALAEEVPVAGEVPVGDGAAAPAEAAVAAGAEAPPEEPAVEAEAPALVAPEEPAVEAEEPAVAAPAATSSRAPSGFLDIAAVRSAAEGDGLKLPDSVYAAVVAALATGKHVVIAGPAGSGKTTLALAIAKAAVQAGRSEGAALATASPKWTASDTVGRVGEGGFSMGHVLAAAGKKKWLVIDEIERAKPDKAFGDLSSFLAGLPLSLPDGSREVAAPKDWRIVATRDSTRGSGGASAALQRRFAEIRLPRPAAADLEAAIDAATEGDPTAASVVKRLLADDELDGLGAGAFLDAARYAAERNAILPASEDELAAELRTAYLDPHRAEEDDD
jgi:hypothetical protein